MPLRIRAIKTVSDEKVELTGFNVLVGPNNSGKSQTLRDIRDYIGSGDTKRLTILKEIEVDFPIESEVRHGLNISPHQNPNQTRIVGLTSNLQNRHEFVMMDHQLTQFWQDLQAGRTPGQSLQFFGRFWVAHLDAESRLKLASPTDCYDTRTEVPTNALQSFFAGGKPALEELRKAFHDAFNIDIAFDWAAMKRWYLRVGPDFGAIPDTRAALDALLKDAQELVLQGDGYRSFAGVVLAMLTFPNRLLLLDEPEAFLHPAQARVLGNWLAVYAHRVSTQVVLATHNADFLAGIISANTDPTFIRLNRSSNNTCYHAVPTSTTKALVQSPLLSSQPVLDSLFQKGVVICEGDPDRAIYQTIAQKWFKAAGGQEVLFIHTNGKDAIKTPLRLLREAGTPVCAIADIDVLNSERVFIDIIETLTGAPCPEDLIPMRKEIAELVEKRTEDELLTELKASVQGWMRTPQDDLRDARKKLVSIARHASKWDAVKSHGVECFEGAERTRLGAILKRCQALGLFIVEKGELEGWMDLGVPKGKEWNRRALEAIHEGTCPSELQAFVGSTIKWLRQKSNIVATNQKV